jgi:hypothetical protein
MGLMVRMGVACVVLTATLSYARAAGVPRDLDDIAWVVGCWTYTTPRGTIIDERWTRPSRDTLAGSSRTHRGGATIASEVLTIVMRGDSIVYIAEPSGQARTEFVATTATASGAVFENPTHDFPQRISYRPAGDSLHARIDGIVDGRERAVEFPMIRSVCEPVPGGA